jgi:hypothetical protein
VERHLCLVQSEITENNYFIQSESLEARVTINRSDSRKARPFLKFWKNLKMGKNNTMDGRQMDNERAQKFSHKGGVNFSKRGGESSIFQIEKKLKLA